MTFRLALRSLQRTPIFTITVILSLALGIASAGSMFAIMHGVLLAPLPYGEPDRLVSVGLQTTNQPNIEQPPAIHLLYQQYAKRVDGVGFYRSGNANIWGDGNGETAERVTAGWVTASTIPLLKVSPLLGRSFTADEERQGGANSVILSESVWRTRFGGTADVIGKTLMVNSISREIVGVMPSSFGFPTADTLIWLPVRPKSTETVGDFSYHGIARLSAEATPELAREDFTNVLSKLPESYPRLESGGSTASWLSEVRPTPIVQSLHDEMTGGIARTLWMLAAAAGLVLLVAWANAVNLMLVRADSRQLELAVREALGAGRLRNATHFLGESLLLAAAAGILALSVTYAAIHSLLAFGPVDVPRLAELKLGYAAVGFILFLSALSAGICSAIPVLGARRTSLALRLGDGARGQSIGKSRQRLRASVTALQIALALVVSIASVLLLRTANQLYEVQPGFETNRVTVIWTQLPFARYDDAASVAFYDRLARLAQQVPSVSSAGVAMRVPLVPGEALEQTYRIDGDGRTLSLPVNVVDNGYFAAMKIPLVAGRVFRQLDQEKGSDIMISASAATTLFGDPTGVKAIGRRLALAPTGPVYTVIGVVGDVRDRDLATPPTALVYRPQVVPIDRKLEPGARRMMALVVKSSGPADMIVSPIRQIVREMDPTVPTFNVATMDSVISTSTARLTLALVLMTAAAVITLVLGAIGLYGIVAYMVATRMREFGVRLALGADPKLIARSVVMRGLALTAGGVLTGLALYAVVAPFLRAFLYGVTTSDPVMLLAAIATLFGTALLASWIPARRASRIDPAEALRAE